MAAPVLFTGTDVTAGVAGVAKILSMDWSGIERPSIDTTHSTTATAKTFLPGELYDPGEVTFEIEFEDDSAQPLTDLAAAAATVTIDMGGEGTGSNWSASGFMTGFDISGTNEEMMTATVRIKFTGAITAAGA